MNPELNVLYPSVYTAHYATGQWQRNLSYNAGFELIDQGKESERLTFNGDESLTRNHEATFFRVDPSQGPNSNSNPLTVRNFYWVQATIPPCVKEKLFSITNNSGKFLVFERKENLPFVWEQLKAVYAEGKLGYGLQCSTSKYNSHARNSYDGVITVHVVDSFDLDEVAYVAWQIDQARGRWSGVLQFMTDRTTKHLSVGTGVQGEEKMLYSISSHSFVIDAMNGGTEKKAFGHFLHTFKNRFTTNAQERQNDLRNKNWRKFI